MFAGVPRRGEGSEGLQNFHFFAAFAPSRDIFRLDVQNASIPDAAKVTSCPAR